MKKYKTIDEKFESHNPAHIVIDLTPPACELLALVMAEEAIHKMLTKQHYPGIMYEYAEYRKKKIIRLLIEIATSYRLTSWQLKGKKKEQENKSYVGLLFHGEGENGVRLTMHEACNKIIHADEIIFETRKVRKMPLRYMKDQIFAEGTKQGKEWSIGLWIDDFCETAITMPFPDIQFEPPKTKKKNAQQK